MAPESGQQLGLARARGGFYPSPRLSVLKGLGVLDAQESGTPAEAEGATSPEAGWYSGSPHSSTPLSPPQEALFVKLGRLLRRRLHVFTRRILLYPGSGFRNLSYAE